VYEPGGSRGLAGLAAKDWENDHLAWEQRMKMVDMSDNCFDEMKHEKDPSLLASFLNSTLLGKTPTSTRTLRPACHDDRRTATSTMSRHAPPHATHCLRCSRECAPI
jgi:hypothetical protein